MHRSLRGVVGVMGGMAAAFSCVGSAMAAAPVPIRGYAAVTVTDPVPPQLQGTGVGVATALGRFTRTETLNLHEGGAFDGFIVFRAAGGHELRADFVGQFTSQTTAAGTYTFTGGTGRFAGASGHATFTAATEDGVHFAVLFDGALE